MATVKLAGPSADAVPKTMTATSVEIQTCHAAALDLSRRRWFVVFVYGVHPGPDGILVCCCRAGKMCERSPGKHPRMRKGYQKTAPTEAAINTHYTEYPFDNVGVLTTGLIGIDLDTPKADHQWRNAEEEWEALQYEHGRVPDTLTAITGSGGKHLLFRHPPGREGISKLPMLPQSGYKGVIDVKGKGGLIVVAPSLHVSGNRYRWIDPGAEIATLPTWLYREPEAVGTQHEEIDPSVTVHRRTELAPTTPKTPEELDELDIKAHKLREVRTSPNAVLGYATAKLIREGRPGRGQSHVVMSICKGAASVGYDPDRLYAELTNPTNRGGLGIREATAEGGPRAGRERFDRALHQAYKWLAEHLDDLAPFRAEAESYEFPKVAKFKGRNGQRQGVEGKNCREILMASLALAEETITTAPMLGCDDLAEISGLHRDTCRKALEALEALGWWKATNPTKSGAQYAYVYRFSLDPASRTKPPMKAKAVAPRRKRKKTDPDEWLLRYMRLHGGEALSSEVKFFAKTTVGISERTIKRSAQRLGIISTHLPEQRSRTVWHLPSP
jgi:hypothetical protein